MVVLAVIETERLILRDWKPEDIDSFTALNADKRVMEYFPKTLTREETLALIQKFQEHSAQHGFGPWAVELKATQECIGFVGLFIPSFEAHFTPAVEIGWRIAYEHWNKGYATEAAHAAMEYGFSVLRLSEIVSFTVPANVRSRRVMEKLGMTRNAQDDFKHPRLPQDHP